MERALGLLVVVVLLLVIMPGLLYVVGWAVKRYADQAPVWINFLPPPKLPSKKPGGETPAKVQA
jgi:hypothetical protein